MRKLILLFFLTILPLVASAATKVEIDGIYYNLTSSDTNTAEVTSKSSGKYSGDIVIPASVTYDEVTYSVISIGWRAFMDCSNLTSVKIPNSVTSIDGSAFVYCSSLTSITIPNSVTSIGSSAFFGCSSLTSVTIPNSVTSIGSSAFADCSGLNSLVVEDGNTKYDSRYNCNAIIETQSNTLISGCKNTIIPNSVTSIGYEAFRDCHGLTSITIPNSVTSIGEWAFAFCSGLTSVTIPNDIISINMNTFYGCSSLTSVNIPSSVTSIGIGAFRNCYNLTFVNIPNNVTSIGGSAFYGCNSLTSVTIPNSVTSIESSTFEYCSNMTSVNIPNSVTSIGSSAFFGCSILTSITIPNSVTSIGNKAFVACCNLKSIIIPNSVTSIGDEAFNHCSLISVIIGSGVSSIGKMAFSNCSQMTDVYCMAKDVPMTDLESFKLSNDNATLYVPVGCVEKYAAVEPWKNFKEIKETTTVITDSSYDVDNNGLLDDDDLKCLLDIILERTNGADVSSIVYDANNDGKVDILDIVQLIGLSNDLKEGRLLDIDEENEGGYEDPTETEQEIMQMESDEGEASEIVYTDEENLDNEALAREVISLYDTDDDSDYSVTEVNKTRGSYDDLAKEAIRTNGKNIFDDEIDIEQQSRNLKNWGNTRYGGFKVFYNTREEDYVRYLYVVFYYKGGFPNKKTAYLKLGQLNSGKIISSTNKSGQRISSVTISPGQEIAVLRVCIDKYLPGYGCFNVFPLLITEESKARNYQNPIFVKSKQIVDKNWRNKYYGYEFGKINGVSVYCNTSTAGWNVGGPKYQCVELCKRYVTDFHKDLKRKYEELNWGHAKNWPHDRKYDQKDPDKYLVFANDGSERVREGDLLVWNHGVHGHIGIVISVYADSIKIAHQNGDIGTYASPIGAKMKLENGIIKDIVPGTNRSPIFKTVQYVPSFIRMNSTNEHLTLYKASMSASTTKMEFSPTRVGKSITQTFIINNPKGMGTLEISSITLSRGDVFSVDVTNCSIEPGDAKVVRVTFTPSASGEYKDKIIIKSDADDNPTWAIRLSGSGKDN